ncbi:MAG: outer membrane protein assembly factor BamA [Pseudomonadota bacterium]|nr:outer membrane protein assembly factor BamA [Pseudomonadota bacterium]
MKQTITQLIIFLFCFAIFLSKPLHSQFRFSQITVQGNSNTDVETIKSISGLKRNISLSASDLNSALKNLYSSNLFETVQVIPKGQTIIIKVKENKRIRRLVFEGNKKIEEKELLPLIKSKERQAFSRAQVVKDSRIISDFYRFKSRYSARVEPKIIERDNGFVDLVFEIDEGSILQISQIDFVGNKSFSDRQLRDVIKSKRAGVFSSFFTSDNYSENSQEADKYLLKKFYNDQGFPDAKVIASLGGFKDGGDSAFLTYSIYEGPYFDFGEVSIRSMVKGISPSIYEKSVVASKGDKFNSSQIKETLDNIKTVSVSNGFPFLIGKVDKIRDFKKREIGLVFKVIEGPKLFVEQIEISGNTHTRDNVIRREFKVEEGDAFDPSMLKRSEEKLQSLGYFESVKVNVRQGSSPQNAIVDIDVKEAPTGSLSLGLGYSTDTDVSAQFSFSESNFRGAGQGIRFSVSGSKDSSSVGLGFKERGFLGRDVLLSMDIDYTNSKPSSTGYTANLLALKPSIGFNISSNTRVNLSYKFENIDVTAVGSSEVLKQDIGQSTRSLIDFSLRHDKRDSIIKPTKGYIINFGSEIAGLGGDDQFLKSKASGKIYQGVFDNSIIFSTELEGGILSMGKGYSKVVDRFLLGGRSFRGFKYNGIGPRELNNGSYTIPLGGEKYAIARLAASFPLGLPRELGLYGSLFAEAGTLWDLKTDPNISGLSDKVALTDRTIRTSIGFAMNWETPIGPLQFNWSRPQKYLEADDLEYFSLNLATRF